MDLGHQAPIAHGLDEAVPKLCETAVKAMIYNVLKVSPEERARLLLGMQHPTPEYLKHMEEFEDAVIELLQDGALIACNGLDGHGFVSDDE